MNSPDRQLHLKGDIYNETLCIKGTCNNELIIREKKIIGVNPGNEVNRTYYLWWLLTSFKPLFFELPVESISIEVGPACKDRFEKEFAFCQRLFGQTNQMLMDYEAFHGMAEDHTKHLFYNVGENVNFKKIYHHGKEADPDSLLYLDFDPGFNPVTRQWEKTPPPMTIEEIFTYVKENRVKKIISINHYFLEKFFEQGIYILPLFRMLGAEYIIVDLDNYDLTPQGYLVKQFYNCNEFGRFSYAQFHAFWDQYLGLKNTNRIAFLHKDQDPFDFQQLDDDYDIVVMSNSRVRDVLQFLNPMLFIMSHFKDGSFFEEIELWYYSLRHMILNIMDLTDLERLNFNALLFRFAYGICQFVKYDVIDSIKTDRQIRIYGDEGWKEIFPEYYHHFLDREEIDTLFSRKRSLNLLMNWQLTWFETSAVIFEALNYRVPFLNHPALVKTPGLQHLAQIEYVNAEQLNQKIENINAYITPELIGSVNHLNRVCNANMDNIVSAVVRNNTSAHDDFTLEYQAHDRLLQERINTYIDKNEEFLRFSFKSLFFESVQYDMRQSDYFPRLFMQRLLKFANRK